jgi:hypothetical protein
MFHCFARSNSQILVVRTTFCMLSSTTIDDIVLSKQTHTLPIPLPTNRDIMDTKHLLLAHVLQGGATAAADAAVAAHEDVLQRNKRRVDQRQLQSSRQVRNTPP